MEQLLSRFAEPTSDPVDLFVKLIDEIRPSATSWRCATSSPSILGFAMPSEPGSMN